MRLAVQNLPSNDLSYTNCVYVHPDDYSQLVSSVRGGDPQCLRVNLKTCVINCRSDNRVQQGEIGVNRMVRGHLRLATKDEQEVTAYVAARDNILVGVGNFQVDLFTKSEKLVIEDTELEDELKQSLNGHVVTIGQPIIINWQKKILVLTTGELQQLDVGIGENKALNKPQSRRHAPMHHGMLTDGTEYTFRADGEGRVRINSRRATARSIFRPDFNFEELGIGGLDKEFANIFRRAFASRVFPPAIIEDLGINHVKGMLLYGPPGTGKTLIARQIGQCLRAREPKIVNGPEVLNKYVGQSEENIRNLFKEAEDEYKKLGEGSQLHIIIFDEIDAICKTRGSTRDSTGVSDSIVNQLLSKIDGVDALNNILLIGMTNRFDMLDEALLRPGRLEVHVEIGLPDENGRVQILNIHTKRMRDSNRLENDVSLQELATRTKNFSGAEIEGLVRSATSWAFNRNINVQDLTKPKDVQNIKVGQADFDLALNEVKPAFGVQEDEFEGCVSGGIIDYGQDFKRVEQTCHTLADQVKNSESTTLMSILLEGPTGAGKTALAAHTARNAAFPFMKFVSPENYVGYSEASRCAAIAKVFDDAYKSSLSIIVLDNIERLIDFVNIGPRFSNTVLQALMVLIKRAPKKEGRRLLVIGTTSHIEFLQSAGLAECFQVNLSVPMVSSPQEIKTVLDQRHKEKRDFPEQEVQKVCQSIRSPIGIKQLLLVTEMAAEFCRPDPIKCSKFLECLTDCGFT